MSIISDIFSKIIFEKYKYINKPERIDINKGISITINIQMRNLDIEKNYRGGSKSKIWFNANKMQYPISTVYELSRHLDSLNQKDLNKLAQFLIERDRHIDKANKLGSKGCIYWVIASLFRDLVEQKYNKPFSLGQFAIYDIVSLQNHLKQIGKEELGQKNNIKRYYKSLSNSILFLVNFKKQIISFMAPQNVPQMLKKYDSQLLNPVLEFIKKYF